MRLKKIYKSAEDPAKWIHHNSTHRTASEAFRDANYATSMWKCTTETDDAIRFFKEFGLTALVLALLGMIGYSVWMLATQV